MADKVFTMRIDENLLEKVRLSAERNKRSLAKEIEFQLEQNLESDLDPSELKILLNKCSDILQDHDYQLRRVYDQVEKIAEHL